MTAVSADAASAAIGAATREVRFPVVRSEALRLAEEAVRSRSSHLGYLAEVLTTEVDERLEHRRRRLVNEVVEVIVLPTHRSLQDHMQLPERRVPRREETSPDGWLDAQEGDPQLQRR